MTTANTVAAGLHPPTHFAFPDPPPREPDEMTSFKHLTANGSAHHLLQHLGNPETTLVTGERYVSPAPTQDMTGLRFPDLLIALDVDLAAYERSNAYVISEQGKPPDFVLEIASPSTGREDITTKRDAYAALEILEYWRFDETGRYHRTRLAGDRLVNGRYEPIEIIELADGVLQGYSEVLNLHLRWEHGALGWYDPATGRHIVTYDDLRLGLADAETLARQERAARIQAEARVRELEEQVRRLRGN